MEVIKFKQYKAVGLDPYLEEVASTNVSTKPYPQLMEREEAAAAVCRVCTVSQLCQSETGISRWLKWGPDYVQVRGRMAGSDECILYQSGISY